MRDTVYSHIKAVHALDVTAISTDTDTDGDAIGLDQSGQDYRTAMAVAYCSAYTDGEYAVVAQECATADGSWTNVPAARVQGSGTLDAANGVAEVGIIPAPAEYPFLRVRITSTETDTGASVGALLLLGQPLKTPITR